MWLWSGAVAFAGSLACTAYVFAAVWPRAADLPTEAVAGALAFDALLFSTFALHHSLLARTRVKAWLASTASEQVQRTAYVWIASVLLAIVMLAWTPIGHRLYVVPPPLASVCAAVQIAGVLLVLWAGRVIDPLELAGVRPANRTRLEVRGPYRLIRHPIYLGWMLAVWGAPTMTGDRGWFAALSSIYLVVAMRWEEAAMRRVFGDAYDRYRARVPYRVLPGIY